MKVIKAALPGIFFLSLMAGMSLGLSGMAKSEHEQPVLQLIDNLYRVLKNTEFIGGGGMSQCEGQGDASCEGAVVAHVNAQRDKQVNFIAHLGNGRFAVSIIDISNASIAAGGEYSAEMSTDCNCQIIGVSVSQ